MGQLRVDVVADFGEQVSEFNLLGTGETNNSATIIGESVQGPYPALFVTSITPPTNSVFGSEAELLWTVLNSGNATLSNAISDRVYLSSDATLGR